MCRVPRVSRSPSEVGGLRHRPQPVTLAPELTSIPATAAVWGPGKPLPLCRGHRGQRPAGSGSKTKAGCEQAPGDGDLMMQNLMTRSLWGGGTSLGGRGGGGRFSHQLSTPGFAAKARGSFPTGARSELGIARGGGAQPSSLQSLGPELGAWPCPSASV